MKPTFDYIVQTATSDQGLSRIACLQFHAWNPNGLMAIKAKNDEKISQLVDEGKIKSGWILAYGSFEDFDYRELQKLLNKKRKVTRFEVSLWIKMTKERIEKVNKELLTIGEAK